jgi:SPP1 family predicted phage head-tail adaptor
MWPYPWNKSRNPFAIPPGAKRNQIQIQQKSSSQSPTGSPQAGWVPVLTCMAALQTLVGREVYQSGTFSGQMTHRVSIDWPGASVLITAGMQVALLQQGIPTRTFTIQAPPENVQERNRVLHLLCLEISGQ